MQIGQEAGRVLEGVTWGVAGGHAVDSADSRHQQDRGCQEGMAGQQKPIQSPGGMKFSSADDRTRLSAPMSDRVPKPKSKGEGR